LTVNGKGEITMAEKDSIGYVFLQLYLNVKDNRRGNDAAN